MAKRGVSPTARRAREKLVAATLECLMAEGADGCSVRKIADRAGVSIGVINYHYPSIQDLVADAYAHLALTLFRAATDAASAFPEDPRREVSAFIESSFGDRVMNRANLRAWIVFWGMVESSSAVKAARDRYKQESWHYFAAMFERLDGVRPVHPTPRLAAIGLSAMIDGLWLEWCLHSDNFSPTEAVRLCEAWVDSVWAGR